MNPRRSEPQSRGPAAASGPRLGLSRIRILQCLLPLLLVCLCGCSGGAADVQVVTDAVLKASGGGWKPQFEMGVGGVTLGLARATLSFADIDRDAHTALRALRGVNFSLHRRYKHVDEPNPAAMLREADAALLPHGWQRMVTVLDGREKVLIYTPAKPESTYDLQVCVIVLQPRELIVASAKSDLAPLMELAWRHSPQLARAR